METKTKKKRIDFQEQDSASLPSGSGAEKTMRLPSPPGTTLTPTTKLCMQLGRVQELALSKGTNHLYDFKIYKKILKIHERTWSK